MFFSGFDDLKFEKAKVIARFNRLAKILKLLHVVEVAMVLAMLLGAFIRLPASFEISRRQYFVLPFNFFNPHVVFLVGNSIIVVLFILSRENGTGVDAGTDEAYVDSVTDNDPAPTSLNSPDKESTDDEQQVDCSKHEVSHEEDDAFATAIEEASKLIRRFQRTQSEKLKREIEAKPLRELRRTQTEMKWTVLTAGKQRVVTSLDRVNKLSSEEFQLKIDAVIAEHQNFLYAQKLAEQYNYITAY